MSLLLLLRSGASAQAAAGTVAATSGTAGTATSLLAASGTVAATSSVSGDAGIIVAPQQYPAAATVAVV